MFPPGSQALAVLYCEGRCWPRDRRRDLSVTVDDLIRRNSPRSFVSSKDAVELESVRIEVSLQKYLKVWDFGTARNEGSILGLRAERVPRG